MLIVQHPMLVIINIIAQTIFLCIIIWITLKTSWFSYILFLIFLGGLMVLFVYICRLASNEHFKIKIDVKIIIFIVIFIIFLILQVMPSQEINTLVILVKIFSEKTITPTIIRIFYLLVTLIVVIKITDFKLGPVRSNKT